MLYIVLGKESFRLASFWTTILPGSDEKMQPLDFKLGSRGWLCICVCHGRNDGQIGKGESSILEATMGSAKALSSSTHKIPML